MPKQNGRRKAASLSASRFAYEASVWALELDVTLLKKRSTVWIFTISWTIKKSGPQGGPDL
ncbi:hypothetical protein [Halobacillus sp. A5]|uniref:hypothetical protein n=1 Tax=Halobacillus sp. A5 TaxID=2880263 RepID=UPI0020A6CFCB|nr:hypothetical protein [Halobacillus sp. A5]MCP3027312.1 hypothetical protein [Halobacillus sp. A5]